VNHIVLRIAINMDRLTQWATSQAKRNLSNYNYKFLMEDWGRDTWYINYLTELAPHQMALGRFYFLMICDDETPVASWLYNGAMPGSEGDGSDYEKDHWRAPPISNTLWKKEYRSFPRRAAIFTLPVSGQLFVPVTFEHETIFGDQMESHAALLRFDADSRSIEFFEPNGPSDFRHDHWVAAVTTFTTKFTPDWSFRDVGSMCQPHTWYKYKHGVCSLWVLAYAMLRITKVSPAQIGLFFLELGPEKASNLISNLFLHLMEKYLPTEDYHRALRDYTIPDRYQRLLPADYHIH
jgi:hypothetical protein